MKNEQECFCCSTMVDTTELTNTNTIPCKSVGPHHGYFVPVCTVCHGVYTTDADVVGADGVVETEAFMLHMTKQCIDYHKEHGDYPPLDTKLGVWLDEMRQAKMQYTNQQS